MLEHMLNLVLNDKNKIEKKKKNEKSTLENFPKLFFFCDKARKEKQRKKKATFNILC